jgi:hypothetical protein
MKLEHKKLGLVIVLPDMEELLQRDVDRYMVEFRKLPDVGDYSGRVVKAAAAAGWICEPAMSADMVDEMKPAAVRWLAQQLNALYTDATTIPPN